jgi:hypothetical protein
MEQLAADLGVLARDCVSGPVVDRTGLKSGYDFEMTWTRRYNLGRAGSDAITMFDAIDQQLGLKLEQHAIPVPALIVDSADGQPSPNPPGVERALPPLPPPEFEVATIRPSRPDATNEYTRSEHGVVSIENFTLKDVIRMTWEAYGDDSIANAPKFLDSAKYDIRAKAPPAPPGLETDPDDVRLMLEKLLEQRYHLKTHMEEREANGFALSVIKPKLRPAALSARRARGPAKRTHDSPIRSFRGSFTARTPQWRNSPPCCRAWTRAMWDKPPWWMRRVSLTAMILPSALARPAHPT